jgi:uracil-DNA glycosylase
MDGAVGSLWSEKGLSKQVNRATSLRNFMKMLLVADGALQAGQTSGDALAGIAAQAQADTAGTIQTLADLQDNLTAHGFLLLNASLVFRAHVAPVKDARAWKPSSKRCCAPWPHGQAQRRPCPRWSCGGKIAEQLDSLPLVQPSRVPWPSIPTT